MSRTRHCLIIGKRGPNMTKNKNDIKIEEDKVRSGGNSHPTFRKRAKEVEIKNTIIH